MPGSVNRSHPSKLPDRAVPQAAACVRPGVQGQAATCKEKAIMQFANPRKLPGFAALQESLYAEPNQCAKQGLGRYLNEVCIVAI
ncbi:hypothetical protein [Sphingobium chlorophenolicum]|uniref:hypothetical protein n=1 Tax=Sphingobium chlorophenolicum TaxID=46429 RepID=UPI0012DE4BCC|nr:hypothetical protein [Sphingobium chlorophenolicum]